jgi:hypothetical protein
MSQEMRAGQRKGNPSLALRKELNRADSLISAQRDHGDLLTHRPVRG